MDSTPQEFVNIKRRKRKFSLEGSTLEQERSLIIKYEPLHMDPKVASAISQLQHPRKRMRNEAERFLFENKEQVKSVVRRYIESLLRKPSLDDINVESPQGQVTSFLFISFPFFCVDKMICEDCIYFARVVTFFCEQEMLSYVEASILVHYEFFCSYFGTLMERVNQEFREELKFLWEDSCSSQQTPNSQSFQAEQISQVLFL